MSVCTGQGGGQRAYSKLFYFMSPTKTDEGDNNEDETDSMNESSKWTEEDLKKITKISIKDKPANKRKSAQDIPTILIGDFKLPELGNGNSYSPPNICRLFFLADVCRFQVLRRLK